MSDETGIVYALIDPRVEVIVYIGQTLRSLQSRLAGHMSSKGTPVTPWIQELRSLGLRPVIRPVVSDVPRADLNRVEREQIQAHYEAGWPLWNLDYAGGSWPEKRLARARFAYARAVGGVLLERAQRDLDSLVEREAWMKAMRRDQARRDYRLYPRDPARYRRAIRCHLERYRSGLTVEQIDLAVDMLIGMVEGAAKHGVTFRQVMSRYGTVRSVVDLIDNECLTFSRVERERVQEERRREHRGRGVAA